jgi:hypothetical protein
MFFCVVVVFDLEGEGGRGEREGGREGEGERERRERERGERERREREEIREILAKISPHHHPAHTTTTQLSPHPPNPSHLIHHPAHHYHPPLPTHT